MRYEGCDPAVMKISETQAAIAKSLNTYVSSFIASADPNAVRAEGVGAPEWLPYSQAKPQAMVFGLRNKELVGGEPGPSAEMMEDTWVREESEFWWSKVEKSQQ